ncbi:MAG: hypothetical protein ACK51Q_08445 [Betaproteobacteria bacterium]
MTTYVILPDAEKARAVSRVVSQLALPLSQRTPRLMNDDAFTVITHTDGRAALVIPDGWTFRTSTLLRSQMDDPLDNEGVKAAMASHLPQVFAGGVTTLAQLQAFFRGAQSISMIDIVPHLNPTIVRNRAQMVAEGWWKDAP